MDNRRDSLQSFLKDFFVSEIWDNSELQLSICKAFGHLLVSSSQVFNVAFLPDDTLHPVASLQCDKKRFETNVSADTCNLVVMLVGANIVFRSAVTWKISQADIQP